MYTKKSITLFCLSLFLAASVQGQPCPSREAGSQPAKARFANASLPPALADRLELFSRIQQRIQSSSACMILSELGIPSERLFAADGELISILDQNWEEETWMDDRLETLEYDENGMLATSLTQIYEGGQWINESFFTLDINQNGVLIGYTKQNWVEGAWVNVSRSSITLDAFGNKIQVLDEIWVGAAWVGSARGISNVNEQGLVVELVSQYAEEGVWINAFRDEFEYDETGREIVDTFSIFNDISMEWELFFRTLTSYPDDTTIQRIDQLATEDMGVVTWANSRRTTTTYNEQGNPIEALGETEVTTGVWENARRTIYTYNEAGQVIEDVLQEWDMTGWVNIYGFFDTYDGDGNIVKSVFREWINGAWVNAFQNIYGYGGITAAEDELPARAVALDVFPSPANERVHVNIELPRASTIQVDVYDLLGRHVVNLVSEQAIGSRELLWEPAQLPAGIYFIRLQADRQLQTRSVIVMR